MHCVPWRAWSEEREEAPGAQEQVLVPARRAEDLAAEAPGGPGLSECWRTGKTHKSARRTLPSFSHLFASLANTDPRQSANRRDSEGHKAHDRWRCLQVAPRADGLTPNMAAAVVGSEALQPLLKARARARVGCF